MAESSADVLIIGGGPSAFGALLGLVSAGIRPTLLSPQGSWPGPSVDPGDSSKSRLARKARFGSTEMYRYPRVAGAEFSVSGPVPVSAAPGGLSTVWGSNIQVFSGRDLDVWGPAADDMPASYSAILSSIPFQGADDGLSTRFPWPADFPGTQPLTSRVRGALARASRDLSTNVQVGVGRNATAPDGQGCIACGRCLDGCPEGVIFDAGPAIARLVREHDLPVVDGLAVGLSESGESARVEFIDRCTLLSSSLTAGTVLLAAGSIASTSLLARSGLFPDAVDLDDTQVFYAPILPTRSPEPEHTSFTLAQMFVTGSGAHGAPDFHLSLYESDTSFAQRAEGIVGPAARLVPQRAYRQLMAAIGFIPAAVSGRIVVSRRGPSLVTVTTRPNPASSSYVADVLRHLRGPMRRWGLHLLSPLAHVSDVGASYHVGHATSQGSGLVCVESGQVGASGVIRVVDGAALPVVPTGPVTLTIMANAHRIARGVGGSGRG